MNPIQLSHPPIREAVYDIQVGGQIDVEALRTLAEQYGKEHGLKKTIPMHTGFFEIAIVPGQPAVASAQDRGIIGFRIEDEPATRIVQFRTNGFSFSMTGTYDNWPSFRDRALVPARRFLASSGVDNISRVALRYINAMRFSDTRVDLDEYLPAAPSIPPGLPQSISGFFSRVVFPIPEDDLTAVVTQALEDTPQAEPSVILDIDVFCQKPMQPNEKSWEQAFEKIRNWKNRIFFEYVNEKTVSLYR